MKKVQYMHSNTSIPIAFFHLRVHVPSHPPFWRFLLGVQQYWWMENGACPIASTISLNLNSTVKSVWLFILLLTKTLFKTLCMFLSRGHSPGTIKNWLFISLWCSSQLKSSSQYSEKFFCLFDFWRRYMFHYYLDLTNYQNCQ